MTPSDWLFGPDDAPIRVRNAEALLAELPFHIAWPFRWAGDATAPPVRIEIRQSAAGDYSVVGPAGDAGPFDAALDAAAALADALIAAYIADDPSRSLYDAAAVATPAGLVLLCGDSPDAAAMPALALAARGYRLFATDRIAVRLSPAHPPTGICLGAMPVVRGPVPPDAAPALVQFIGGYTEMRRGDRLYLKLWAEEAAVFGEMAPLAGWIRIAERPGAETGVTIAAAPFTGVAGYRVIHDGLPRALELVTGIISGLSG